MKHPTFGLWLTREMEEDAANGKLDSVILQLMIYDFLHI